MASPSAPMLAPCTLDHAVQTLATMRRPRALLGDIVLASESADFTAVCSGVGLGPDGGMSWLLPRPMGLRRASEIIPTDHRVNAEEAAAIGLTRVVADADLAAEGTAIAAARVAAPTAAKAAATGAARSLLPQGAIASLDAQLDREAEAIRRTGAGGESREGVAAFLARRPADFQSAGT